MLVSPAPDIVEPITFSVAAAEKEVSMYAASNSHFPKRCSNEFTFGLAGAPKNALIIETGYSDDTLLRFSTIIVSACESHQVG